MVHFTQIRFYFAITNISTYIEYYINSSEDREKLYVLLNEVLRYSHQVNKLIESWVLNSLKKYAKVHQKKDLTTKDKFLIFESVKAIRVIKRNAYFSDSP